MRSSRHPARRDGLVPLAPPAPRPYSDGATFFVCTRGGMVLATAHYTGAWRLYDVMVNADPIDCDPATGTGMAEVFAVFNRTSGELMGAARLDKTSEVRRGDHCSWLPGALRFRIYGRPVDPFWYDPLLPPARPAIGS
jgi:hypothetical protein